MHDKIQVIMDLMKDLQSEMEPSADDLDERLGRKKPDIAIAKIDVPMMDDEGEEEMDEEMDMEVPMDESPEDKLKNRIMKMRG